MKTKILFILAISMLLIFSVNAQEKENRFGFELNTGASIATKKLGGEKVNPGVGFEGIFHYHFLPHTGV